MGGRGGSNETWLRRWDYECDPDATSRLVSCTVKDGVIEWRRAEIETPTLSECGCCPGEKTRWRTWGGGGLDIGAHGLL